MFKFWRDYHPPVHSEITGTYEAHKCLVRRWELGSHTGTHVDAPAHFFANGKTLDDIPLTEFLCRTRVLDAPVTTASQQLPQALFQDLDFAAEPKGILLRTGWESRWGSAEFYQDFPVLPAGLGRELVERGCRHLAVDFPLGIEVHEIFLGAGRLLIENLTNLGALSEATPLLIALPLRLRGAEAAPARVVAVEGLEAAIVF